MEEVFLSVACGRLKSSTFTANTEIEGRVVGSADIERLMAAARTHVERDGRTLLHMNCISYRLDGAAGIGEPLGLAGRTLGADLHAVTADEAPLRNLLQVVERAYLSAAGLVPAPYASGLAATTEEERQLGVVAIDIGAGTTTLAAFAQRTSAVHRRRAGRRQSRHLGPRPDLVGSRLRSRANQEGIWHSGESRRPTITS